MPDEQMTCLPGAPSWVSLMARDIDAAEDFYGPLLGWRFEAGPDRWGPYAKAMSGGVPVAGVGAVARTWEFPVHWTTYFGVTNADTTASRLRERGGTLAVGPLSFDAGRLALAADPAGASFGLWQCDRATTWHPRPRMTGAPVWIELRTRDAFEAAMFYGDVFAWDEERSEHYTVEWEHDRVVLRVDGKSMAGLFGGALEAAADPRVRPRWHVYFSVPDVDVAARSAEKLGGQITEPPSDTAYGCTAGLRDPEGALFSVISNHQ